MKKLLVLFSTLLPTLTTAAPATDKDGVPVVDLHGTIIKTTDPQALAAAKSYGFRVPSKRMITVGSKQMSLDEFLRTYCPGKDQNSTCARGVRISLIDSSSGPVESLPKGL
jgi:hypothetical protein